MLSHNSDSSFQMIEYTRKLPIEGPRHYTLRDAYRGRVWRSPIVVLSRELLGWSIAATLFGFLLEHGPLFSVGTLICILSLLTMIIGSIATNRKRVEVIRDGRASVGTVEHPGRILVLHELLKSEREKTVVLKFRFKDANGKERKGRVWVCGCAREYFPVHSESPIVYDPDHPSSALPLRLGVMVAPH